VDQVVSVGLTYVSETPYLQNSFALISIPLDILNIEAGFPNCGALTCMVDSQTSTHANVRITLPASSRSSISLSISPLKNYRSEKLSSQSFQVQIKTPDNLYNVESLSLVPASGLA